MRGIQQVDGENRLEFSFFTHFRYSRHARPSIWSLSYRNGFTLAGGVWVDFWEQVGPRGRPQVFSVHAWALWHNIPCWRDEGACVRREGNNLPLTYIQQIAIIIFPLLRRLSWQLGHESFTSFCISNRHRRSAKIHSHHPFVRTNCASSSNDRQSRF